MPTTDSAPKLSTIVKQGSLADVTVYAVNVTYPGEDTQRLTFHGPTSGYGPVVMVTPMGTQTFVTDPGRFGAFGPEWVRRFFA